MPRRLVKLAHLACAGAIVGLAVGLYPAAAAAEIQRYALLVGSNRGQPHETPLRYAESDVQAVAEALVQLGGFRSERIVQVVGASATRVRSALIDLELAMKQDLRAGGEAVLFVYYSGHADGQNLHLGSTELATEELSKLVRLSPAKLKILLLDACRAGTLTRVKGGRIVPRFQIGLEDQLRNEGYAVITSSAAGEDAQESDALGSSIFTHHFISALRGPGDTNGDRLVTLGEAYAYTYDQALKTSLTTIVGSQHATFEYDLRGRADPVLADLRTRGDQAELLLTSAGDYLVMNEGNDAIVAEANVRSAGLVPLRLPAGAFRVRMRTRTNVYESRVSLAAGARQPIGEGSMRPLPLAQVVRKGETELRIAHGPTVMGSVHGPLGGGFSPMVGAQVGWAIDLPRFTLLPRLGLATGRSELAPGGSRHTLRELSLEFGVMHVFDLGRLSLAPLVSAGWALLDNRFDSGPKCAAGCTQTGQPQGLITTIGGWANWPLGRGLSIDASLELANFYFRRQQSSGAVGDPGQSDASAGNAPRSGTLTFRTGLGLGYRY